MSRSSIDVRYLRMAKIWSENSYAIRKKVGCIMVKDRRIISDGYNGTPTGFPNSCENRVSEGLVTKPEVLHAEANAITKLAKSTNSSEGATLYVTCSPCFECAKLIIQAGITRVFYEENYHDTKGLDLLVKAGIEVYQIIFREGDKRFCPDSETCNNFRPWICDEHCYYEPNIKRYESN